MSDNEKSIASIRSSLIEDSPNMRKYLDMPLRKVFEHAISIGVDYEDAHGAVMDMVRTLAKRNTVEPSDFEPGIYRVYWRSSKTSSVAAVYMDGDQDLFIVFVEHDKPLRLMLNGCADMEKIERITIL